MAVDEGVVCPACFITLAPVEPGVVQIRCPRCHHVWNPAEEELKQTVEHTPMAKRRSSRPG